MKESIFRVSLDIHTLQSQMTLGVKKGETSRKIGASLTEHGMPYIIGEKCFATFQGTKADGTKILDNCTIENNQIIYSFTEQTTAVSGILNADFILYGADGGIIASPHITIIVDERAIGSADTIISEDELLLIDNIAKAEAKRVDAEELRAVAEDAREFAETGRVEAELKRESNTITAIENAEEATEKANNIADTLQDKLDKGEFKGDKGDKGDTPAIDQEYNPESENAQSGIAVAQALSGASGVKYITENVMAHELEDGIYIVDNINGGSVWFSSKKFDETFYMNELYDGMIIVSYNYMLSAKQIVVFSNDNTYYQPKTFVCYVTENGTYYDDCSDVFTSKSYVDEQVKTVNGIKVITEEVNACDLDYGIYYIDTINEGVVNAPHKSFQGGMVFVVPEYEWGGKQVTICGMSLDYGLPSIESYVFFEDGEYADVYGSFATVDYVEAKFDNLNRKIGEETLYTFNCTDLGSSILSKEIGTMTRYDVPTIRIKFKLKVANVNADGTITPYFNLPIEYMSNPTLMMDSYIKNIADFKSFALKSPLLSADFKSFEEMTTKLLNQGIARGSDIRIVSEYDNDEISISTLWFLSFKDDTARDDTNQQMITPVIDSVTDFALKYEKHNVSTVKPKLLG